jgi:peptide/nickel transport system substrate-binding protein
MAMRLAMGGVSMETPHANRSSAQGLSRRELLQAGLAAGAALSAWPRYGSQALWAEEAGLPKRGGILRVRGYDPPHFDPLTLNFNAHTTLSFVYSRLLRHKVGAGVPPGTFTVEPDLAERWEALDDTTYVFHLCQGVRWHNKPPVKGRELVAEDVKVTFDRFLTEKANPLRFMLDPVDRVEVVDRYTVKFLLKEPFVWLVEILANPVGTWIIAPEVVDKFGDLKKPESAIGTGPFMLERYEPNVKTVFTRNPDYFRQGQPHVDRVEWLVLEDDSSGLAMYRTGQIDAGPWHWWAVRQEDLDSVKKSHPHLLYQDFMSNVTHGIWMRTDQPPFNDVRVRRAISRAIDRQAIIDAVFVKGEPTPAISRGVPEWSPRIDELGPGARYYQYDPKEARRLLAEAGFPKGFKTQLHTTNGVGPALTDAVQLAQRYLKDVGIEADLKIEEFGAYTASTFVGKFEGLAMAPFSIAWEPHNTLYGMYMPDQPRNSGHVNDPKITAMLKEQMRTQDLEARKQLIFDTQRYMAEQQYYVYLYCVGITASWQPYVKNYAPNPTFDYGGRAAALWLER